MEMVTPEAVWNCRIDTSGRIVLPRDVRSEKNWKPGDEVSICRMGDDLVIHRSEELLATLLEAFRESLPEDVDLVEELVAERRLEAAREAEDH